MSVKNILLRCIQPKNIERLIIDLKESNMYPKFNIKYPTSNPEANYKTMLEIAKELNVDKQQIYRCIKKYNMPYKYKSENGTMYFDEAVQTRIKSIITQKKSVSKNSNEVHQKANKVVHETHKNMYFEAVINKLDTIIDLLQKVYELQSNNNIIKDEEP